MNSTFVCRPDGDRFKRSESKSPLAGADGQSLPADCSSRPLCLSVMGCCLNGSLPPTCSDAVRCFKEVLLGVRSRHRPPLRLARVHTSDYPTEVLATNGGSGFVEEKRSRENGPTQRRSMRCVLRAVWGGGGCTNRGMGPAICFSF